MEPALYWLRFVLSLNPLSYQAAILSSWPYKKIDSLDRLKRTKKSNLFNILYIYYLILKCLIYKLYLNIYIR